MTGENLEMPRLRAKFGAEDKAYLKKRKEFAEAIGAPDLYEYLDHFGLYSGTLTLGNKLATYEYFKRTVDVPGHIMEFGVWKGANLMFLAKILKLMLPQTGKRVFGFDNFTGLPDGSEKDGPLGSDTVGLYEGNRAIIEQAIRLFDLEGTVYLVEGDASVTIPAFADEFPDCLVSFAYIDFDLYDPCKAALDFLGNRLAVGGVIVFDEALDHKWPGETLAMLEHLKAAGQGTYTMEANTLSRQPTMVLIRQS